MAPPKSPLKINIEVILVSLIYDDLLKIQIRFRTSFEDLELQKRTVVQLIVLCMYYVNIWHFTSRNKIGTEVGTDEMRRKGDR